jgi:putative hemolysin
MAQSYRYPELSYSNPDQPPAQRWLIRSIEGLTGRERLLDLYELWRESAVGTGEAMWSALLELVGVEVQMGAGAWPPADLPPGPVVMVANHPFGIGDGIAALALAERLGRPYRVLVNKELLKAPEIRPYALAIDFDETPEALKANMATRKAALEALAEGATVVVFPAGGVATARRPFGRAQELPWKTFTAKMIRAGQASVIPIWFEGQNGPLFHLASRVSPTLRLSLLVREFKKRLGRPMPVRVGRVIPYEELKTLPDRKALMDHLYARVHALGDEALAVGLDEGTAG